MLCIFLGCQGLPSQENVTAQRQRGQDKPISTGSIQSSSQAGKNAAFFLSKQQNVTADDLAAIPPCFVKPYAILLPFCWDLTKREPIIEVIG